MGSMLSPRSQSGGAKVIFPELQSRRKPYDVIWIGHIGAGLSYATGANRRAHAILMQVKKMCLRCRL
jgi:hypothetical protein